jgi:hypothetical protein
VPPLIIERLAVVVRDSDERGNVDKLFRHRYVDRPTPLQDRHRAHRDQEYSVVATPSDPAAGNGGCLNHSPDDH